MAYWKLEPTTPWWWTRITLGNATARPARTDNQDTIRMPPVKPTMAVATTRQTRNGDRP